jgi:DNA-binding transcriptional MocR family regulator
VCDYLTRAYDQHVVRLRTEIAERRALARETIAASWSKSMRLAKGAGGFYLWATAPREMRARALLEASERLGATFLFGEAFFAESGGDHNFRLAITTTSRADMVEGIERIGRAIEQVSAR